eukprot:GHVP01029604.1.p1 GENE.GHVP01029604.1~~GHVP01029604.1.p1  ORF type:complete len:106 (+),score=3.17 GHVP01029604.1:711-1028(+)
MDTSCGLIPCLIFSGKAFRHFLLWSHGSGSKTKPKYSCDPRLKSGLKKFTSLYQSGQSKITSIWTWASTKAFLIKLDFVKVSKSFHICFFLLSSREHGTLLYYKL